MSDSVESSSKIAGSFLCPNRVKILLGMVLGIAGGAVCLLTAISLSGLVLQTKSLSTSKGAISVSKRGSGSVSSKTSLSLVPSDSSSTVRSAATSKSADSTHHDDVPLPMYSRIWDSVKQRPKRAAAITTIIAIIVVGAVVVAVFLLSPSRQVDAPANSSNTLGPSGTPGPSTNQPPTLTPNVWTIVGGVLGGAAVLIILIVLVCKCRQQNGNGQAGNSLIVKGDNDHPPAGNQMEHYNFGRTPINLQSDSHVSQNSRGIIINLSQNHLKTSDNYVSKRGNSHGSDEKSDHADENLEGVRNIVIPNTSGRVFVRQNDPDTAVPAAKEIEGIPVALHISVEQVEAINPFLVKFPDGQFESKFEDDEFCRGGRLKAKSKVADWPYPSNEEWKNIVSMQNIVVFTIPAIIGAKVSSVEDTGKKTAIYIRTNGSDSETELQIESLGHIFVKAMEQSILVDHEGVVISEIETGKHYILFDKFELVGSKTDIRFWQNLYKTFVYITSREEFNPTTHPTLTWG